jgi:hypothetical protein
MAFLRKIKQSIIKLRWVILRQHVTRPGDEPYFGIRDLSRDVTRVLRGGMLIIQPLNDQHRAGYVLQGWAHIPIQVFFFSPTTIPTIKHIIDLVAMLPA